MRPYYPPLQQVLRTRTHHLLWGPLGPSGDAELLLPWGSCQQPATRSSLSWHYSRDVPKAAVLGSMVTPAQQVMNSATHWTEKSDLLFGLLQFMSLLPFDPLTHLNGKDNSHHKNERSVPILFLFFVAEVLGLLYIGINHPDKTPLPWRVWEGRDGGCSLHKAQAHFSHFWELPLCSSCGVTSCDVTTCPAP